VTHCFSQKLVEEFCRNPEKDANSDIAQRTFAVADSQILLKFHYAPGKITAGTCEFIKPPLTEMAEKLTFNPDLTAGYQVSSVWFNGFIYFTSLHHVALEGFCRMMLGNELE
jgi:hypothetical protein